MPPVGSADEPRNTHIVLNVTACLEGLLMRPSMLRSWQSGFFSMRFDVAAGPHGRHAGDFSPLSHVLDEWMAVLIGYAVVFFAACGLHGCSMVCACARRMHALLCACPIEAASSPCWSLPHLQCCMRGVHPTPGPSYTRARQPARHVRHFHGRPVCRRPPRQPGTGGCP